MRELIIPTALYVAVPKSIKDDCFYTKRQSRIYSGRDVISMLEHTTKEGEFYFFDMYNIHYIGPEVKIVKKESDGNISFEIEDYNVNQT